MTARAMKQSLLAVVAFALMGWLGLNALGHRDPAILLSSVDQQKPGTVQSVKGYWIARLPSGEYRVFLDREPHSGRPLRWYPDAEESYVKWDFLWRGGSLINRVQTPKDHFGSPVYGEIYTLDGTCVGGPCDKQGLYVVPTRVEGKQLMLTPGPIRQVGDRS